MSQDLNYFEHFYQQASQDPAVLEKNANDYPYSSLAGFLLLYHYKKTNNPGFEKLAKKVVLQFDSVNWLQFILDQTSAIKAEPRTISREDTGEDKNDGIAIAPEVKQTLYDERSG